MNFEYAEYTVETKKSYSEMIFSFYNNYVPGTKIYQNGRVKASDIRNYYTNLIDENSKPGWEVLKVRDYVNFIYMVNRV